MFVLLEDRFREGGRCAGALVASAKRIAPQHLGSARARPSRSSAMPEVPPASPLWQGVPVHHPCARVRVVDVDGRCASGRGAAGCAPELVATPPRGAGA